MNTVRSIPGAVLGLHPRAAAAFLLAAALV